MTKNGAVLSETFYIRYVSALQGKQALSAATTTHFQDTYVKNLCTSQGLEKYGVGKWREISEELLPKWDDQAIRIKASRLMGSQSLARYVGWKGNR